MAANMVTTVMLRIILMTAFTLIIWIIPVRKLHNIRWETSKMLLHWASAFFGEVGYKNIVMSSVLLTLRVTMIDFTYLTCLYTSGAVIYGTSPMCSPWRADL